MRRRPFLASVVMALLIALPTPAAAQAWGSIDLSLPMANSGFILSQQIVSMTTPKPGPTRRTAPQPRPDVAKPNALVPRVPVARALGPAKLAQAYPIAARPQAERMFRDLLGRHSQLMSQFGVADNDMAGALAAFIAGSYMAYHNADFPDAHFKPLIDQMRKGLNDNPDLMTAGAAARRDAFEQLAILGMMSAGTQIALRRKPDATLEANMREAGGQYLSTLLKTDPANVKITASGLSY